MLIRGEALIETITLAFTISGKRGEWAVSITAPGGVVTSDETTERTWFPLFTEMLASSYEMLVAGDFRGGRSPVRHGDDNTGAASPHADVGRASRHALLAGFLQVLGKGLSPFAGEQGQRLIASIARHNKISADRVQKHYCAYLRAYMAITDHLIHPGTETIN